MSMNFVVSFFIQLIKQCIYVFSMLDSDRSIDTHTRFLHLHCCRSLVGRWSFIRRRTSLIPVVLASKYPGHGGLDVAADGGHCWQGSLEESWRGADDGDHNVWRNICWRRWWWRYLRCLIRISLRRLLHTDTPTHTLKSRNILQNVFINC